MRLVILNDTLEGKKIANNIYNENGIMFLREGSTLTLNIIKRLLNMGITSLYIEDDVANSLILQEVLDSKIKLNLIKKLMELFTNVKKKQYIEYQEIISIVDEIIKNINLSENAIILNNFTKNDSMFTFCTHAIDVTLIAIKIGSSRRYDIKKLTNLALAAILHDVGKLISQDEHSQHHAVVGYSLLRKNVMFKSTTYMSVLNHHEFEDGSGPMNEKGERVYEFAKIINISDMYINNINANKGCLPHEAIEKITALGLNKINEDIYRSFINSVTSYPNGLWVKLNTGVEGIVIKQNINMPTRPIIAVKDNGSFQYINLAKELNVMIDEVIL